MAGQRPNQIAGHLGILYPRLTLPFDQNTTSVHQLLTIIYVAFSPCFVELFRIKIVIDNGLIMAFQCTDPKSGTQSHTQPPTKVYRSIFSVAEGTCSAEAVDCTRFRGMNPFMATQTSPVAAGLPQRALHHERKMDNFLEKCN